MIKSNFTDMDMHCTPEIYIFKHSNHKSQMLRGQKKDQIESCHF